MALSLAPLQDSPLQLGVQRRGPGHFDGGDRRREQPFHRDLDARHVRFSPEIETG